MWLASSPVHYSPDCDCKPDVPIKAIRTLKHLNIASALCGSHWLACQLRNPFQICQFSLWLQLTAYFSAHDRSFPKRDDHWLIDFQDIINTGKHVTRQYCQIPGRGILISGSKGIKDAALYSDGCVINDKSEKAEKSCEKKMTLLATFVQLHQISQVASWCYIPTINLTREEMSGKRLCERSLSATLAKFHRPFSSDNSHSFCNTTKQKVYV